MKSILIDAGPIIALFNKNDKYHYKVLTYLKGYKGKLFCIWPVITEVSHMLMFSLEAQIDFLKWVRAGALEIAPIEVADIDRIIQLADKYSNVPMDLADASLVLIAEKHKLKEILTIDNDYYIYRTAHKEMLSNVLDWE
jgi:predicted nucleic acid-binding protein